MGVSPAGPGDQPYAAIFRYSRWSWSIKVHDGITVWGPDGGGGWSAFGTAEHARRKAKRKLRAYLKMCQGGSQEFVLPSDLEPPRHVGGYISGGPPVTVQPIVGSCLDPSEEGQGRIRPDCVNPDHLEAGSCPAG